MMKRNKFLLTVFISCLSILGGCRLIDEQVLEDFIVSAFSAPAELGVLAAAFHMQHSRWPVSKEQLVTFQAEREASSDLVNLDNWTNMTFEILPDGRLKIGFDLNDVDRGLREANGSVTVGVPEPEAWKPQRKRRKLTEQEERAIERYF